MPATRTILGRELNVLTPHLVQAAHSAGKLIHIWTVDDSEIMERLIEAGVDGIFADRIDTLKSVLLGRGLWTSAAPGSGAETSDQDGK